TAARHSAAPADPAEASGRIRAAKSFTANARSGQRRARPLYHGRHDQTHRAGSRHGPDVGRSPEQISGAGGKEAFPVARIIRVHLRTQSFNEEVHGTIRAVATGRL